MPHRDFNIHFYPHCTIHFFKFLLPLSNLISFSFCDNCDFKYSLLSPVEWEELERIKMTLESNDINVTSTDANVAIESSDVAKDTVTALGEGQEIKVTIFKLSCSP